MTHRRASPREWTRKLWHIGPGVFGLLVPLFPHTDPTSPLRRSIVLIVTTASVALFLLERRRLSRPGERDFRAPVFGYAIPVALSFLLFPAKIQLGLSVLAILAFGDGVATLAGKSLPRRPLPWNPEKTFAGLLGFVMAATPAVAWMWWAEANPMVSVPTALILGFTSSAAAALAESVRSKITDNLRVGITALATLWVVDRLIFVGVPLVVHIH